MNSPAFTRPGGEIVLVNHLGAETGPAGRHESDASRRWPARLGWHPEFRWQRLEQWAARLAACA